MKSQDLKGMIFGEWTVLERDIDKSKEKKSSYWFCKCSCGDCPQRAKAGWQLPLWRSIYWNDGYGCVEN